MKAAVYTAYGPPDVVQIAEVAKPIPKDDEALVQVRAVSVNPYDWHVMRGEPYPLRLALGLRKPKFTGLGADLSGVVESVGRSVTRFKPGDGVFGIGKGAFAEYACAKESALAAKADSLAFDEGASVGIAARGLHPSHAAVRYDSRHRRQPYLFCMPPRPAAEGHLRRGRRIDRQLDDPPFDCDGPSAAAVALCQPEAGHGPRQTTSPGPRRHRRSHSLPKS